MKILLGDTRSKKNLEMMQKRGWGRMFVVNKPAPYPFEPWGFDNMAFPLWLKGLPFDNDLFKKRLEKAMLVDSDPYMAVTPDIVANGEASLPFSLEWRMNLTNGWPWYLAVQDHMEINAVEDVLHLFSGIFLGGSDKFKSTAYRWSNLAHKHQKKFHYGRASTHRKLRHAYAVGSDSCDTSFPLWTSERMRSFCYMYDNLGKQDSFQWNSDYLSK